MKSFFKNYVYPVATLVGGIIGAGFLSLPYITLKVGIWPMLAYFFILTALVVVINVIFGKIALKTPDFKRWPGFVEFHLGRGAKLFSYLYLIPGLIGVLLVYLIVGGQFLNAIFGPIFGGSAFQYSLLYFICGSLCIYVGVKFISRLDFAALVALVVISFLVLLKGFPLIHLNNIFISNFKFQISNLFLPYGAILFSLWGVGLVPEVEEMVIGNKKSLKKIIIIATLIASVFYLAFILLVLGISGAHTTESSLTGLAPFLGRWVTSIALLIGAITTFTAFIAEGLLLKKVFMYDMGLKEFPAWMLTCVPPLILFMLGFNLFIPLISLMGGLFLGIDGIFILLMYRKIGGKKIVTYPLMLVFVLGIIYSVVYFVN